MISGLFLGLAILIFTIPSVWALENNIEYTLQGEKIFVVFEILENNELSTIDGGILTNNEWQFFDIDNIKHFRSSEDFNKMRLFGTTDEGDSFYLKWVMTDNEALLMGKLWQNDDKFRIIEKISLEELFYR